VALDGKPPSYGAGGATVTGTQPRIYGTGNAAAWNADTLQLGSCGVPFAIKPDGTGAVTDA
jgi:hypothetical protein